MGLRTTKLGPISRRAAGVAVFGACAYASGQTAAFIPLGHLPGGDSFSAAYGVSPNGLTIVGASQSPAGVQAVRWSLYGGIIEALGDLPDGAFFSFASAVSADGSVVVGSGSVPSGPQGFVWTASAGMVGLGSLPGGDGTSNANGISSDGTIVVGNATSTDGPQAFIWNAQTGMLGLGDLAGGEFASSADAVSADGTVVVGYGTTLDGFRAFRWMADQGMVALGLSATDGEGSAYGLSSTGDRIVGYTLVDGGYEAFEWTASSGVQGVSIPGQGPQLLDANGTSGDGFFIVGAASYFGSSAAAIYDPVYGTTDLKQTLIDDYGLSAALLGWRLTSAYAVSADGMVIAGEGVNPVGQVEAWAVVFPRLCRVPQVVLTPEPLRMAAGSTGTLTVAVASVTPVQYQWRRNGVLLFDGDGISGAQTSHLTFLDAQRTQAGQYDVVIDNGCGSRAIDPVEVFVQSCIADFNHDGNVDPDDLGDFITCFFSLTCPAADYNADGNIDPDDLGDFITNFFSECH